MAAPYLTTLPDIVLREIFLWAIAFANGYPDILEAPLNLSQTCRSLRAFALSQGCFWSYVNLTDRGYFKPLNLALGPLWLARTDNSDSLLDISIDLIHERMPITNSQGKPMCKEIYDISMQRLIATQSRWKRFALHCDSNTVAEFSTCNGTVDNLQQLCELVVDDLVTKSTDGSQTGLFINGTLKLSTIAQTQTPIAPRLVHLHMHYPISRDGLGAMLDHCPALECITTGTKTRHFWPARGGKGVVGSSGTLNRLSRISISDCAGLLSVLNDGRAPALEAVEIYSDYGELGTLATSLHSPHIGPLVRRARLVFTSEDWEMEPSPGDARDDVYRALPNVTHLYLTLGYWNADYDLESLSFGETGRRLLPELEYFKMSVCYSSGVDYTVPPKALEKMLVSRMLHSDHFRAEIDVSGWRTESDTAVFLSSKRIRQWVDSGRLGIIWFGEKLSLNDMDAECRGTARRLRTPRTSLYSSSDSDDEGLPLDSSHCAPYP